MDDACACPPPVNAARVATNVTVCRGCGERVNPAPVAPLRGVVAHRFSDGVLALAIESPRIPSFPSPRTLYIAPAELPGAVVGDRVTIRIEVTRGE